MPRPNWLVGACNRPIVWLEVAMVRTSVTAPAPGIIVIDDGAKVQET